MGISVYDLYSRRRLLSVLDGTSPEPGEDDSAKAKEDWAANNAVVMSALLGSMHPGISLSLRGFSTAAAMWQHLTTLYSKASASRKFDVELDLANLKQGDRDVSTFYQDAMTLWTEHDLLMSSLVPAAASADVIRERTSSRVMRFLMHLRAEFESVRASLLHRNVDTMEEVLAALLREETRLRSQSKLDIHASDNALQLLLFTGVNLQM
ncbi:unnamed protein product [Linum trigynum]|uniref:Retrotransposon gag domain-containing protein n=1 Tax=Linum trigynum TaxID=586398 RepID=A0AAV2ELX6_9ROSI